MKRVPLVPTVIVVLAVAAMVALGVWQLQRRSWKEALIAQYAANEGKPAMAYPSLPDERLLFRRATAYCLQVVGWQREGGRSTQGVTGWRHIAQCRTGAEGPVLLVDTGLSADPNVKPRWTGGEVSGTITQAPTHRSLLSGLFGGGGTTPGLMLVADTPAPGLQQSARPDPSGIPNNHLAYAVQWFIFAALAAIIYVIALRRRWLGTDSGPTPPEG